MTKEIIIIALIVALIYLYYQNRKKPNLLTSSSENSTELTTFLQTNLNSNNLEELKTKLGEKTLDELLEENEDYETEVDTLTRKSNSLEQDLTAQSKGYDSRLREKDREIKKLKEDLGSEKQQHKGSLERIKLLTEQITDLQKQLKKMPGEFPKDNEEIKKT